MTTLFSVFMQGVFLNNFILVMFLGLCSFFGVSKETKSALGMSATVTFVLAVTTPMTWLIYYYILEPLKVEYLWIVAFILVIATYVQSAEFIIRKKSPSLYRALGIYLPLVASNCAILGAALLIVSWRYTFVESIVFGVSAGLGYSMVLLIMSGIRERLELSEIPRDFQGAPIAFIVAGILSMAFMHYFGVFVI
ncbi:electron transport complex protein RnfA [archaeon BMS3Abin16]|nr:electron transport complex protein RnfA [archaeon BMS3Abin16]